MWDWFPFAVFSLEATRTVFIRFLAKYCLCWRKSPRKALSVSIMNLKDFNNSSSISGLNSSLKLTIRIMNNCKLLRGNQPNFGVNRRREPCKRISPEKDWYPVSLDERVGVGVNCGLIFLYIYHINYGVLQGFPDQRKAVTTRYFFTCVWYRQSAADTSLAFRATRSNEWTAKSVPFSIQGRLSDFFGLWLPKHWKIRIATDSDVQTFLEGKDNQKEKNWGEKKDYS